MDDACEEYFIIKGCLRAYYIVDGEEKTTEFYTEFEPVSPICVAANEPSAYYLCCLEDTILIVSDADVQQNGCAVLWKLAENNDNKETISCPNIE